MEPGEASTTAPATPVGRFASFRPLRHRDFALVWFAALVSNIGTWMQTVAVGALVTDLTGEARWAGLVAAAAFLPIGVLSPVGGALADRVDRRRFLIWTTVGETAFAMLLAVLYATGNAPPAGVSLVVLAGGACAALGFPSYQSILPELVPREDLLGAISLSAAQYNFGRVLGPAAAGVLIRFGSYSWAFAANAVSFAAVVVALSLIRVKHRPVVDDTGLWERIRAGARGARAEPGCRLAILLISFVALTASPFIALVPAVAQVLFDEGAGGTSLLVTTQGVGAVVGALALAPLAERLGRRRLLLTTLLVLPLSLAVYASMPNLILAAVALTAVGAIYIGVLSGLNTVVQIRAPEPLRGRILSLYFVALGVVYPVGAFLQGALADRIGVRTVTAAGGAILLIGVGTLALLRPRLLDVLDDPG